MALAYHLLGIVHDLIGIVAYAMAIHYYAAKLKALKQREKDDQQV
jgi:hypothetical protein